MAKLWESDQIRLESTGQRAEPWCRATRGYRCHWDAEAGVPYSTVVKSVLWEKGRRLLVSKDTEGKPMIIESRQSEVRRALMVVKPMTQGQWVCFWPDHAFAYKIENGRVIPFESTPNGWNLTVELKAPNDANSKLQEVMDIMMEEKRREHTENIEHMMGLLYAIKQKWIGPQKDLSS